MTLIKNVTSTPTTNVVIRNEASFVECFFFCVALLDKRVASWSSVSNFSNSATLRCACLLPICLLGMLNDLGCRFFRSQNRLYFTLSMQYEILNKTLKGEIEIKVKRGKEMKPKRKICSIYFMPNCDV